MYRGVKNTAWNITVQFPVLPLLTTFINLGKSLDLTKSHLEAEIIMAVLQGCREVLMHAKSVLRNVKCYVGIKYHWRLWIDGTCLIFIIFSPSSPSFVINTFIFIFKIYLFIFGCVGSLLLRAGFL